MENRPESLRKELRIDYDDSLTDFNNEQLDPDINDLFPEEHVHWKPETEEDQQTHTQSTAKEPPKPSRYNDQEDNRPVIRSGSVTLDTASDSSSDFPLYSDESTDLDALDGGQLFAGMKPEVTNDTLVSRRNPGRPAKLDLGGGRYRVGGSVRAARQGSMEPPSSAKFIEKLQEHVEDPEAREKLRQEFEELNEGKNNIAIAAWKLYEENKEALDEIMSNYWTGPGEERRRVKAEKEAVAKEKKEAKRERKIRMALGAEMNAAGLAGLNGGWNVGLDGWLVSPESGDEMSDELGSGDEDEKDEVRQREIWSPDDEDGKNQGHERQDRLNRNSDKEQDDNNDDEWPGDRTSRVPLTPSTMTTPITGLGAAHHTRASTLSTDKPLPCIPAAETAQTVISIHILLRLAPLKAALAQHLCMPFFAPEREKEEIHRLCALTSSICRDAEDSDAPGALQGRCAFYMGLAEFLRSRVDEESEGIYALVVWYFDNAWRLCDGVYEEGAWGEEWARWLKGEKGYYLGGSPRQEVSSGAGEERRNRQEKSIGSESGVGGSGLIEKMMAMMRSWSGGHRKGMVWNQGVPELETGKYVQVRRPESVTEGDDEPPPKQRKPVGLGITTAGVNAIEPIIPSPDHPGIYASPENYTSKIAESGVYSHDAGPSPLTQDPPARRYHITNPDPKSTESSGDSNASASLSAPVTTPGSPAVCSGGRGIMGAISRRFSAALSPTDLPPLPASPEGIENSSPTSAIAPSSLAARRRQSSSLAALSMLIRGGKAPMRSQDDWIEAEEGNSPRNTEFDKDVGGVSRSSGVAKRSPLGDGGFGEDSGLRRRKSGPMEGRETV